MIVGIRIRTLRVSSTVSGAARGPGVGHVRLDHSREHCHGRESSETMLPAHYLNWISMNIRC